MPEHDAPTDDDRFNPEALTPSWRRRLKASEPGRVAAALYRRRRMVRQILSAPGGLRAPRLAPPVPTTPADRRRVRLVCWMPAGPGALEALLDTWASAAQSAAPGEIALLVTDDWTTDCHAEAIRAVIPDAVVIRTRVPSGGPPRLWPVVAAAIGAAQQHFVFDYLVKLDSDALVVGPGWVDAIRAALEREAGAAVGRGDVEAAGALPIGVAGAYRDRPDGHREVDESYHRRVLAGELPHDQRLADWHDRAVRAGWPEGSIVQGGCLVMTSAYVDALVAGGTLTYRPRLRTIVSEDLLLTLLAYAAGFSAASIGSAAGPLAIANKHLPVPLDELLDPASRWAVTHSTKVGLAGEREADVRARAREARERWS